MSQNIIDAFIKNAQARGLSESQINAFIQKQFNVKSAEAQLDDVISGILKNASIEKSAQSVAYVQGILKTAVERGFNDEQAVDAATKIAASNNNFKKVAAAASDNTAVDSRVISAYSEGFMKSAQEYGFSEGQSLDLLKSALVPKSEPLVEKQAAGLEQLLQSLPPGALQEILGGGAGALAGGVGGAAMSDPAEKGGHPGRNALLGALGGGALGAGGAAAAPGGQLNPDMMQLLHHLLGGLNGDGADRIRQASIDENKRMWQQEFSPENRPPQADAAGGGMIRKLVGTSMDRHAGGR